MTDSRRYIAEQRDLGALAIRQWSLAAAHQHVGLDAERGEFAHAVLGRLGLEFTGGRDERHQRHMDIDDIGTSEIGAQLPDRLDEWQRLDIANSPANLAQHEIDIVGIGPAQTP